MSELLDAFDRYDKAQRDLHDAHMEQLKLARKALQFMYGPQAYVGGKATCLEDADMLLLETVEELKP